MSFGSEMWQFLRTRNKLWLLPVVAALLLIGMVVLLTSGSALAPFIYTLF